ncbi:MAG: helix-turn-helix transcriptional regulator [Ferruginibacter sp.]
MNNLRDKKILIDFGNHIRTIRKRKGLSMEQLSFMADVELSQIYRIEKGKINPTLTTLKTIADALEISYGELFSF